MTSKIQNSAKPRKGCGCSLLLILFTLVIIVILSLIRGCTAARGITEFTDVDYIVEFLNSNPTREDVYSLRVNASYLGSGRRENPDHESTTTITTGWFTDPLGGGFVSLVTINSNGEPRFINNTGNREILIADTPRRIRRSYLGQVWFRFEGAVETYGLTGFRTHFSNTDPLVEITLREVKELAGVDWLQFNMFDQEIDEIIEVLNSEYGLNAESLCGHSCRPSAANRLILFYIDNVRFEIGNISPHSGATIHASLEDE